MKGDTSGASKALARALELDENNLEALSVLISLDLAAKNRARAVSRIDARLARTKRAGGAAAWRSNIRQSWRPREVGAATAQDG